MTRNLWMQCAVAFWLAGTCAFAASPTTARQEKLDRYEFHQILMGVEFNISLYAVDQATANRAARAVFRRVRQLDDILSDYDPDSELMRFCRTSGPGEPVNVSPELSFVLSRSLSLSKQTDGAFDISVGPVVKLWRRARRKKSFPEPAKLAAARKLVGYQSIHLDHSAGTAELAKPQMLLDLGGIAKGYAGDEALAVLRRHGITRALIDASGDIVVGDPPPGKSGWLIGIAPLSNSEAAPSRFLTLSNSAVATSGDAFQSITIEGKRYSHIVDPKTGLGLSEPSSVTVVAPDGITADSLASAVSVLGPQRGLKLIECTDKTAALVVVLVDGEPKVFSSRRMSEYEAGR